MSPTAAKAIPVSACPARAARTPTPLRRAAAIPSCHSAVLPIPASPSSSNAYPPAGTASMKRASACSSSRLPMIRSLVASRSSDSGRCRSVPIATWPRGDCEPGAASNTNWLRGEAVPIFLRVSPSLPTQRPRQGRCAATCGPALATGLRSASWSALA